MVVMPEICKMRESSYFNVRLISGERLYHLKPILETENSTKTSLFQYLVWQSNLAVVEHPVFKYLIEVRAIIDRQPQAISAKI